MHELRWEQTVALAKRCGDYGLSAVFRYTDAAQAHSSLACHPTDFTYSTDVTVENQADSSFDKRLFIR